MRCRQPRDDDGKRRDSRRGVLPAQGFHLGRRHGHRSAWERVAEQCDAGAAHVYARTPVVDDQISTNGSKKSYKWTHVQKITSRDVFHNADADGTDSSPGTFGHAVAVDGDTMVVSHYIGRYVNVYTRSDPSSPTSLWTLRHKLEVPSLTMPETNKNHWTEGFGFAVAIRGDTVVVSQPGAYAENDDDLTGRRMYRGAVHVFTRDVPNDLSSTWRYVSRLSTDAFSERVRIRRQTDALRADGGRGPRRYNRRHRQRRGRHPSKCVERREDDHSLPVGVHRRARLCSKNAGRPRVRV